MNLSPLPLQKFFDNDGRPLVAGLLFIYAAGTTTKVSTWQEATGASLNSNPIVLNFRGEARVWLDPALAYKFVLAPASDTDPPTAPIWTVDDITAGPPSSDNAAEDTGSGNSVQLDIPRLSGTPQLFDRILWKSNLQNTGPVTITINGGLSKSLLWQNREAVSAGALQVDGMYEAIYDGLTWQLQGPTLGPEHMITVEEFLAGVSPADYSIPSHRSTGTCFVDRYGVNVSPGSTDMTSAIQSAVDAAKGIGTGGVVEFGSGVYKVTSTILVDASRIHIRGAGRGATRILFAPTANDVLFEFHNGSSAMVRNSLKGVTLYSDDATFTKTAIDLYDIEEFELDDVEIAGGVVIVDTVYWSGANSIGLRTRGRQLAMVQNVQISADRPILISVNPNNTIDIDHFNFCNLYLIANANPCVEIETGVDLTNVAFSGKQAWVKGTDGLRWIDTTSASASILLTIDGVRWEQGTSATAYLVRIEHNVGLNGLHISNCYGGVDRRGYLLRKVNNIELNSTLYAGTGIAFDVNSTCRGIKGVNTFWQAGSTSSITGQVLILGSPPNPNSGALPPNFEYDEASNGDETLVSQSAFSGVSVTIAQDATATIGTTALIGFLFVQCDENVGAIYALNGAFATTTEVSDPGTLFTNTVGTAASYNIYATGGNFLIQNKRTGSHKVRWLLLGTQGF